MRMTYIVCHNIKLKIGSNVCMYVDVESGALGRQTTSQRKKCGVVRELVTIADFFFMYVHYSIFSL